ncbi:S8 family serine peptidase [Luteimonas sp. BDR2-5]|uniref:S8 family peptidase n=1 Tax=Proluteimonas luteida TaxID=2878685 RepID=UPI001E379DAB|nr:S8 family peptidase [Luteimonas sp. BDR2-5]MCD9027389.1 S8 family serine peptidase [Luteimonas sp. BDR2-5]
MKKGIIPCTLAVAVSAVLAVGYAGAAGKAGKAVADAPPAVSAGESQLPLVRFIVEYKDGARERSDAKAVVTGVNTALSRAGLTRGASAVSASYERKLATGHQLVRLSRGVDRVVAETLLQQIAADPNVKSVQLDRLRQITAIQPAYVPDDPDFDEYQWHMRAPDGGATYDGGPNRGGANVPAAWDLSDGEGITIAVIDTGITAHPDIDTSLADAGYDFISDAFVSGRDTDDRVPGGWDLGDWTIGYPGASTCAQRNSSWHGTHVAGTAGAQLTDNGVSMTGVAYGAKHLPVRVLGHCGGYESDIVDAIIWAAGGEVEGVPLNENPAQVINLSLGGSGPCSSSEAAAIAQANSLGATVVIAAGNSNSDVSNFSPANCPGAIAVASNGVTSRRAYYSNYGTGIDISAPGGGVYANDGSSGTQIYDGFVWQAGNPSNTTPTPVENIQANYARGSAGTSQASPHVAGVVALLQSARLAADLPLLTPAEVLEVLQQSASPFTVAPSASQPIGPGILDAGAAVVLAVEGPPEPCDPEVEECAPPATPIDNKVPVRGLSGSGGDTLYSIEVPAGTTGPLSITTSGGSGNVSLYVSFEAEPAEGAADFTSTRPGNSETVRVNAPQAGVYYIKLSGSYSNVTLQARF